MASADGLPTEVKDRVFDAVQAELRGSGLDKFSIDGVAKRAGVDPDVILARWHDRRVLLMEAMLDRTAASAWNPDTGSLYSDLQAVSDLAAQLSQAPTERETFRRVLPGSGDADLGEIVSDLWTARFRDGAGVLHRAAERGQLRDGILPEEAIRMFAAAFYYDVIFTDSPVRPEYAAQVIDIFLHGVVGAAGRDRPWRGVDHLLRNDGDPVQADWAVEAARSAVVLMRAWADALPDPMVLYEAMRDDQGVIVDFVCRDLNRAACEEVGLSRGELVGRTAVETLPNFASSGLSERYAECLATGKTLALNDFLYRHFDLQRRLDVRAAAAGADLITVTWRDVTDRFESAQRDARYRELMDFSTVPVALASADGRLVAANQAMADLMGYDVETLLTLRWQDLNAPEVLAGQLDIIAELWDGGRDSYRTIKPLVRADGQRIWVDLSLRCIRQSDGDVEHLIGQLIDVTDFFDAMGEVRARQFLQERAKRNRNT